MSGGGANVGAPTESWLSLLRSLTEREASWCLWKNADAAVAGEGDVDSVAPRRAWAAITDEFRAWAFATGAGPVIVCRHLPETLVVAACAASDRRRLIQLDVYERIARIVAADELTAVAELDQRGFRRLRPGAEGLLAALAQAPRAGGRPPDVEAAAALVRSDPAGAEAAARLFGVGRTMVRAVAHSLAAGGWNSPAMAGLELLYLQRALRRPRHRLAWLAFRFGAGSRCPLLRSLASGRRVTGDVEAWLSSLRPAHVVFEA